MEDKAQIQEAIKIQGEVVRKLKSEKSSKEQVSIYQGARWRYEAFYHAVNSTSVCHLLLRDSLASQLTQIHFSNHVQ